MAQRLAERNNRPWIPLQWEPETQIRSYDEMASGSAARALAFSKRYGSKAANLGFLAHRTVLGRAGTAGTVSNRFGYDLVPGRVRDPADLLPQSGRPSRQCPPAG